MIDIAFSRLQGAPQRLFRSDSRLGLSELKSGEAILTSACTAASQATDNTMKLQLLGDGYKAALFNVFCELPAMEGFEKKNGQIAMQRMKTAFLAEISSVETAKQDISRFMNTHLTTQFQTFTYQGLEARLQQLEAALAALQQK